MLEFYYKSFLLVVSIPLKRDKPVPGTIKQNPRIKVGIGLLTDTGVAYKISFENGQPSERTV